MRGGAEAACWLAGVKQHSYPSQTIGQLGQPVGLGSGYPCEAPVIHVIMPLLTPT